MKKSRKYHRTSWGVNQNTIKVVMDLLANEKPGSLLDVGAGHGVLSKKLAQIGFKVQACDLVPENFRYKNIPIKKVDLNTKLPYINNSFDYLICTEVVEHLENPWQGCRELARVLKKGGYIIISLPNFTNLNSRLVFFSRGNFRQFYDFHWQKWGHINPLTYPELAKILEAAGLKIEVIKTAEEIEKSFGFILYLAQQISSAIFHLIKIIRWRKDTKDKSLPALETRPLLFGENLIIKCQKG